jgi:hypothetical protein
VIEREGANSGDLGNACHDPKMSQLLSMLPGRTCPVLLCGDCSEVGIYNEGVILKKEKKKGESWEREKKRAMRI